MSNKGISFLSFDNGDPISRNLSIKIANLAGIVTNVGTRRPTSIQDLYTVDLIDKVGTVKIRFFVGKGEKRQENSQAGDILIIRDAKYYKNRIWTGDAKKVKLFKDNDIVSKTSIYYSILNDLRTYQNENSSKIKYYYDSGNMTDGRKSFLQLKDLNYRIEKQYVNLCVLVIGAKKIGDGNNNNNINNGMHIYVTDGTFNKYLFPSQPPIEPYIPILRISIWADGIAVLNKHIQEKNNLLQLLNVSIIFDSTNQVFNASMSFHEDAEDRIKPIKNLSLKKKITSLLDARKAEHIKDQMEDINENREESIKDIHKNIDHIEDNTNKNQYIETILEYPKASKTPERKTIEKNKNLLAEHDLSQSYMNLPSFSSLPVNSTPNDFSKIPKFIISQSTQEISNENLITDTPSIQACIETQVEEYNDSQLVLKHKKKHNISDNEISEVTKRSKNNELNTDNKAISETSLDYNASFPSGLSSFTPSPSDYTEEELMEYDGYTKILGNQRVWKSITELTTMRPNQDCIYYTRANIVDYTPKNMEELITAGIPKTTFSFFLLLKGKNNNHLIAFVEGDNAEKFLGLNLSKMPIKNLKKKLNARLRSILPGISQQAGAELRFALKIIEDDVILPEQLCTRERQLLMFRLIAKTILDL